MKAQNIKSGYLSEMEVEIGHMRVQKNLWDKTNAVDKAASIAML